MACRTIRRERSHLRIGKKSSWIRMIISFATTIFISRGECSMLRFFPPTVSSFFHSTVSFVHPFHFSIYFLHSSTLSIHPSLTVLSNRYRNHFVRISHPFPLFYPFLRSIFAPSCLKLSSFHISLHRFSELYLSSPHPSPASSSFASDTLYLYSFYAVGMRRRRIAWPLFLLMYGGRRR
jgi:hypothetical protein